MRQRFKFYDITFSTLALVIISSKKKKKETIIEDNFQGERNIWPNQATKKSYPTNVDLEGRECRRGNYKSIGTVKVLKD